jgi:hypothetical protein
MDASAKATVTAMPKTKDTAGHKKKGSIEEIRETEEGGIKVLRWTGRKVEVER